MSEGPTAMDRLCALEDQPCPHAEESTAADCVYCIADEIRAAEAAAERRAVERCAEVDPLSVTCPCCGVRPTKTCSGDSHMHCDGRWPRRHSGHAPA